MGENGLKMGVWLSFFYKFAENREFFQGRFLPYKIGIETPGQGALLELASPRCSLGSDQTDKPAYVHGVRWSLIQIDCIPGISILIRTFNC